MEPVLYDIKDAARYLGVAPSTLRYWEREGLVRAGRNRGNDYRQYALHDLIDASEIAFYRRLGVPVRELAGYRTLSARDLDDALDRTAHDVEQRIAELEAMRARLARQRALNARAEELEAAGMRPGAPAIARLDAIDYAGPSLWPLLVDEPWRFAVLVDAADPGTVFEMVADTPTHAGAVWERGAPDASEGRECLLLVDPDDPNRSNAAALFAEAARQGLEPRLAVGTYLLTAVEEGPHASRWDYYRAWVLEG